MLFLLTKYVFSFRFQIKLILVNTKRQIIIIIRNKLLIVYSEVITYGMRYKICENVFLKYSFILENADINIFKK